MKRLIVIFFVLAAFTARSQEREFSVATTFGTVIPMNSPASTPFTWRVLGYYNPAPRWSVGAGTGLSFYEKTLLPLYGDVRYLIGRPRLFNAFAECAAGYSFAVSGDANGGLFVEPSVGVQCRLPGGLALVLSAGYELQKMERLKRQSDNYFTKEFAEKLTHGGISIRLGLRF
jgi:hypothetical protein